jgi:hypothetical protein
MATVSITGAIPNFIGESITAHLMAPIISGGSVYAPKDYTYTIGGAGAVTLVLPIADDGAARYAITLPAETGRQRPRHIVDVDATTTDLSVLIATTLAEYEVDAIASAVAAEAATRAAADTALDTRVDTAEATLTRYTTAQTLTDAASIAWNTALGHLASVTLGGNRTLAAPTNGVAGTYVLRVTQSTGSHTLGYDAVFKWAGGTAPVLSTAAGAIDVLSFASYDGATFYGSILKAMA